MKRFSLITALLVASSALAQVPVSRPVVTGGSRAVGTQPVQPGPPAYTPTLVGVPAPTKAIAIENNGQTAAQKQGQGGAAAAAALAAMAATMAATCPACDVRGTCPICIAATIGAAASGLTGSNMDGAQSLSNSQVNAVNPTATPGVNQPGFVTSPAYTAAMKDIQKATNGTGVNISKDFKTITTPDGRTLDASKAAGGGGLSGAELSLLKDQMKKAQDAAAKGAAAAAAIAQDSQGSGNEQAGGAAGPNTSDAERSAALAARARAPANIAGASKDLNGDPIGVSVDSMFEMMHRRYRASSDREYFIPPAH